MLCAGLRKRGVAARDPGTKKRLAGDRKCLTYIYITPVCANPHKLSAHPFVPRTRSMLLFLTDIYSVSHFLVLTLHLASVQNWWELGNKKYTPDMRVHSFVFNFVRGALAKCGIRHSLELCGRTFGVRFNHKNNKRRKVCT